jgi:hypothetical protein
LGTAGRGEKDSNSAELAYLVRPQPSGLERWLGVIRVESRQPISALTRLLDLQRNDSHLHHRSLQVFFREMKSNECPLVVLMKLAVERCRRRPRLVSLSPLTPEVVHCLSRSSQCTLWKSNKCMIDDIGSYNGRSRGAAVTRDEKHCYDGVFPATNHLVRTVLFCRQWTRP